MGEAEAKRRGRSSPLRHADSGGCQSRPSVTDDRGQMWRHCGVGIGGGRACGAWFDRLGGTTFAIDIMPTGSAPWVDDFVSRLVVLYPWWECFLVRERVGLMSRKSVAPDTTGPFADLFAALRRGEITRRAFVTRATALGMSASVAALCARSVAVAAQEATPGASPAATNAGRPSAGTWLGSREPGRAGARRARGGSARGEPRAACKRDELLPPEAAP